MMLKTHASTDEGEQLVRQYLTTSDPGTKERAIQSYLPLVKYIIGRINLPTVGILKKEDLYQYGIIGLMEALDRFDLNVGVTFKTFAYKRIYGEVMDAIRRSGIWSRKQIGNLNKIQDTTDKLRNQLGREPSVDEVCAETGLDEDEFYQIQGLSNLNFTLSLDDKINVSSEDSMTRKEVIEDENQIAPHEMMHQESLKEELKHYIRELPEKERLILALYYYEELTLADIGQVLGISESRISQILNKTLVDLRYKLKS